MIQILVCELQVLCIFTKYWELVSNEQVNINLKNCAVHLANYVAHDSKKDNRLDCEVRDSPAKSESRDYGGMENPPPPKQEISTP